MTKVKICGITSGEDAKAASELGADYIGFNFYTKSPRHIDKKKFLDVIKGIGSNAEKVGVFVNDNIEKIKKLSEKLDMIQLHGDESNEFLRQVRKITGKKIIKAFRVGKDFDVSAIERFDADYYMFDAFKEGLFGGTGESFDWDALRDIDRKFFLSGGLNAENVRKAIEATGAFAVDAASGVEESPGKKDLKKMKEFIEAAR